MCEPATIATAMFAINSASAVMEYQGQKQQAKYQEAVNDRNRKNAQTAYAEDLTRIEAERIENNEKTARERLQNKREKRSELAAARNRAGVGLGMMDAQLRDVGFEYDMEQNSLAAGLASSNLASNNKRKDAYAAFQNVYWNQPPVNYPSKLGLGLSIAGSAVGAKAGYNSGSYGKT